MSIRKAKQDSKEKRAHARIMAGILAMENSKIEATRQKIASDYNYLELRYCKYHGDKIGHEVAQADVLRICGIKGEI